MVKQEGRDSAGPDDRGEHPVAASGEEYVLAIIAKQRVLAIGCSSAMLLRQLSAAGVTPAVSEFDRTSRVEDESDPERATLQFVIASTPLHAGDEYRNVLEELIESGHRFAALERENARLRTATSELQRSVDDARNSVAARDAEHERAIGWLREQNRTLRNVQVDLCARLSARVDAAANMASLEAALAERERLLNAAWANAETLVRENEREVALVREEIADTDARLADIHRSVFWKMKLRIVALRGRLRSLVHAAGG